jgi:hypothetical protein
MRKLTKILAIICALGTTLVLLSPGIVYCIGLWNTKKLPQPETAPTVYSAQELAVWKYLEKTDSVVLEPQNPWTILWYVYRFPESPRGWRTASLIAMHNEDQLRNTHMIWQHISGVAMTIWITRHWSAGEVLFESTGLICNNPIIHSSVGLHADAKACAAQ